jgi:hypothetical protein
MHFDGSGGIQPEEAFELQSPQSVCNGKINQTKAGKMASKDCFYSHASHKLPHQKNCVLSNLVL